MTTRVSCPYCNTTFAPDAVLAGRRLECPRCGETFPYRGDGIPEANGSAVPFPGRPESPKPRRSLVWPVGIAVALGLVGLGIGLYVANRPRPSQPQDADPGPTATATPPAELAGLGYLPPDCNLVAAVQPGPLIAYCGRTNQDPRELLIQAGLPAGVFAFLDRAGIPFHQVGHVVAGSAVPDHVIEGRLTVVLVLRRPPADEDQFLDAVGAKKDPRGKPRYNVTLDVGFKLPLQLVRVSPAVWVLGWADADLAPAEGGGRSELNPGFREMIATRLPADAAVWVAADAARWDRKELVKAAAQWGGKADWLPAVAKVQGGVVGMSFGDEPRVRAFVRCADEPTGARLREYLQGKAAPGAQAGGAGEWAMYDAPFDPRAGLPPFAGMLLDVAK
ncbi:MAG: zinc-ribbon domain-containing protein [Gemmataceae bacterium]|nr:zinc-ribbon domain-containing protein [Gemmataceae bacterium]